MIPIRDTIPSDRLPVVNYLLVAANLGLFFYEISLGENLPRFLELYAVVPARLLGGGALSVRELLTPVTATFLHGGWMHLLGNMLYLWIFGDNVEDRLGHGRYLMFYLVRRRVHARAGRASSPTPRFPSSAPPARSPASSARTSSCSRGRAWCVLPLFLSSSSTRRDPRGRLSRRVVPAAVLSGTVSSRTSGREGGVACWAHVGGFVAGVVFLKVFSIRGRGRADM